MAELADASDLKSGIHNGCAGSSPASATGVSKEEIGSARAVVHRGKRLIDYIVNSLENSPATLDRLAEDIVDAGYQSRAKNLTGSIYNAIYNHRLEGNDNVQYHRDTKTYSVEQAGTGYPD